MQCGRRLVAALLLSGALLVPLHAQSGFPMVLFAYKSAAPGGSVFLNPAGDVNGDGVTDVSVGEPQLSVGLTKNGLIRVRSGLDGSVLQQVAGTTANGSLGGQVRGVGDVNGDGFGDIVASSPGTDAVSGLASGARVYSGQDGSVLFEIPNDPGVGFVAQTLADARDVDGDGVPDVVVGCTSASGDKGLVRVYSGATHQVVRNIEGLPGDHLGFAVAAADVNGDGQSDIIATSFGAVMPGGNTGCARVFSGSDGTLLMSLWAPGKYGGLASGTGYRVFVPGDLDHDGLADVGVLIDSDQHNYVRVFSSATGGKLVDVGDGGPYDYMESADGTGDLELDGSPDLLTGNQNLDFPSNVRTWSGVHGALIKVYKDNWRGTHLGDVDADGYPDLGIGAKVISGAPSHWTVAPQGGITTPIVLDAYSLLVPGLPVKIKLRSAVPGALAWLVIGRQEVALPFMSVKLYAEPDMVLGPYIVDADGEVKLAGTWPAGVPQGWEVLFQFIEVKLPPTSSLVVTNALRATQP